MSIELKDPHCLFEAIIDDVLSESPEYAAELGVNGIKSKRPFMDYSEEGINRRSDLFSTHLSKLQNLDRDLLTTDQKLSLDTMHFLLTDGLMGPVIGSAGQKFAFHNYVVSPTRGGQIETAMYLASSFSIESLSAAKTYIKNLSAIGSQFKQLATAINLRENKGVILPARQNKSVVRQLEAFCNVKAKENILITSLQGKLLNVPEISENKRYSLLQEATDKVQNLVYPAYANLAKRLNEQCEHAPKTQGVCHLADGDEYYSFLLKAKITTDITAEQVCSVGFSEIARLTDEISQECAKIGFEAKSFHESFKLFDQSDLHQFAIPSGDLKAALITETKSLISNAHARLSGLFLHVPDAPVDIATVPAFAEQDWHSRYTPPSQDGSRKGLFEINVPKSLMESRLDLPTLVYHEVYPGHHLQLSYAMANKTLPRHRKCLAFWGYIEGWAKYAEQLAGEQRFMDEPAWTIMQKRRELLSTANLVLDTGIHARGWTHAEAVVFYCGATGVDHVFAEAMVDRCIGDPAQLCSYKIGMQKFLDLRDQYKSTKQEQFDLKDFHQLVLEKGTLPLAVLEGWVQANIGKLSSDVSSVRGLYGGK